jgi:predicted nucleotidyltransferase
MIARLLQLRLALEADGVRHAFLFGSARGDDVPESDVDIIVDLDPERHIGLLNL